MYHVTQITYQLNFMNIVEYPRKILRQKTKKVTNIADSDFQLFLKEMTEIMLKEDGIGLAATQVNSNLRVTVIKMKDGAEVMINPKICWKALIKKNIVDEGCLSFPGIFGLVKRPFWIIVKYQDKTGQLKKIKAEGLLSTVIQHELDHLKGVLFIDKIFKYTKGEKKAKELMGIASLGER